MNTLPPFYNLPTEQREAMLFIVQYINTHSRSPSLEEIAIARDRVVPAVHVTIKKLTQKGWLTKEKSTARSITLTEKTLEEIRKD